MFVMIIAAFVAWVIGVWGWAQILGSLQNMGQRGGLFFTLVLWIAIMGGGLYLASGLGYLVPFLVGYALSFIQVSRTGRIE